jgi:RNA polymerase sigma-70 factor (ECF subfamily)
MPIAAITPFEAETLPHLAELRRAARLLSRGHADDLVQETFLRAFQARDRYRLGSNARAWLYKILTNAAHSARRRELRDLRLRERFASEPMPADNAAERPSLPKSRVAIGNALAALPEPYRKVVEMTDVDGLSYREVAARLDVPIGTVMSRLHRARRRLRVALGNKH